MMPVRSAQELLAFGAYCAQNNLEVRQACVLHSSCLPNVRNRLFSLFLQSPATHILCIDDDMIFSCEQLEMLIEAGKDNTAVCGNAHFKRFPLEPVIDLDNDVVAVNNLVPTYTLSLAFAILSRQAIEAAAVDAPIYNWQGDSVYEFCRIAYDPDEGVILGEDIYFSRRLLKAGIVPLLHTGIHIGHMGTHVF